MSLVHADTETLIAQLQLSSPQSLLISGIEGIGLLDVAHKIANGNQVTVVSPDDAKASRPISTEAIRQLYETTRSKSVERQYVIVDQADAMTTSAQGAFLKLLEEPNVSIHFILTSSRPDVLLPTIRSRVQHHVIPSITREQSDRYLTDMGIADEVVRRQLLYIAEGLPQELARLVADEEYFNEAAQRMKDARDLLQAQPYERLLTINSYKDNRVRAQQLLDAAIRMTRRSLSQHPQKSLILQLDKLLTASERLKMNGNVRLTLTQLVV
ncbi:MAG: polymerase delta prime subunit [Candidatus Saccharibacteria bacterium]|nr:polymerase delta prime subunit [Candidatus Saccharibacteria bacterium]